MTRREEIRRRALRAAAAVTGRGHNRLEPLLGAAIALSLASCTTTTPKPKPEPEKEDPTPTAKAPETAAKTGQTCLDDQGKLDSACCIEYEFAPEACHKVCGMLPEPSPDGTTAPPAEGACFKCGADRDMAFFESECCKKVMAMQSKVPTKVARALMNHCTPWGPPAPPEHTGVTIAALLGDAPLEMFGEAVA